MSGSWSHRAVRPLVPALIRIGARPNHVTTAHLLLGLACLCGLAFGDDRVRILAGFGWLFSHLLDRLDGELARIGNMCSAAGHRYDYLVDTWLSAIYFLALGNSVTGPHHGLALAGGLIACLCQLALSQVAERYDRLSGENGKVIPSRWGFDADDALYILGPVMWVPNLLRLVAAGLAGIATLLFLCAFSLRLARLRSRMGVATPTPSQR